MRISFVHAPDPRIAARKAAGPPKVADGHALLDRVEKLEAALARA